MKAEILNIEQTYSLASKEYKFYLGLLLPNGEEIKAEVTQEHAELFLASAVDDSDEPANKTAFTHTVQDATEPISQYDYGEDDAEEPVSEDEKVAWMELSEEQLPVGFKRRLATLQAPDLMTVPEIMEMLAPPAKKGPTLKPSTPRRTVSSDDAGNPIAAQRRPVESDDDDDDDGVAQL